MIKRNDNGCWGVPGGAMELNESFEDTVKREALEEVGITVAELEFFGIYSGPEFHYVYPNGDEVYIVTSVYLTHLADDKIKIGHEEHDGYRFFDINSLPENVSPPIKPILNDLFLRCIPTSI